MAKCDFQITDMKSILILSTILKARENQVRHEIPVASRNDKFFRPYEFVLSFTDINVSSKNFFFFKKKASGKSGNAKANPDQNF